MKTSLRKLVRSILSEAIKGEVVSFADYSGMDLDADCNQCGQPLWLVWEKSNPAKHWTECGGIGEGSCVHRAGRDPGDDRACAVCDKADVTLDDEGLCRMCERMLVRIKMMDPSLDDAAAIAYGRSLRVRKEGREPSFKLSGPALKGEVDGVIHDLGDELGWDYVPDAQEVMDYLADRCRKEYAGGSATYDHAEALGYAQAAIGSMNRRPRW